MVKRVTVDRPLLELGLRLGEGCLWDQETQRLYFLDIDRCRVYTYEPLSGIVGYERFNKKITSIALTTDGDGLVGTSEDAFIFIPGSALPFPPTSALQQYVEIPVSDSIQFSPDEKRFNDGAVDPVGRFTAGTMGREHHQSVGKLYSLNEKGDVSLLLDGVTCSNGTGWSRDGTRMYYTDSWIKEIAIFDYDTETGRISNRRVFSKLEDASYGEPDGLCMDSEDGVWSARWQSGKVVRFSPSGEIDVEIDIPTAWHVTCVVFGGEKMNQLYITTAQSDYNGEDLPDRKEGGHVFVVDNLGYTGVERNRYRRT